MNCDVDSLSRGETKKERKKEHREFDIENLSCAIAVRPLSLSTRPREWIMLRASGRLLRRCEQQTAKGQAQLVYLPRDTFSPARPSLSEIHRFLFAFCRSWSQFVWSTKITFIGLGWTCGRQKSIQIPQRRVWMWVWRGFVRFHE